MSLECCLGVAYYIQRWSYQNLLYFVYLCPCLPLGLLIIWSIFHYFHFHYNWSYNVIKTATLVYLNIFVRSSASGCLLSFCLIFCQFRSDVAYKNYVINIVMLNYVSYVTSFSILSKTECMSIEYHFRRGHESSGIRKLLVNKLICRKNCDYLLD